VNTNYRYAEDELVYLWDNADAVAVVFHGTFTETIERSAHRVPGCGVALGRRRQRSVPRLGDPYETAATTPTTVGSGARGAAPATTS
jgi:3-oxocholest-4-en-26-oate---CoA ligase